MVVLVSIVVFFAFVALLILQSRTQLAKKEKRTKHIKMLGSQISNSTFHKQITHEHYSPVQQPAYTELVCEDMHFRVSIEHNAKTSFIEVTYQLVSPKLPQWFELSGTSTNAFKFRAFEDSKIFEFNNLPSHPQIWQHVENILKRINPNQHNNHFCFGHSGFFLKQTLMFEHTTMDNIGQDDSTVKMLEYFVNFSAEMIKQIPTDAKKFHLELLEQDDPHHPTFKMALVLVETEPGHPLIIESFNRLIETLSDTELLTWLTRSVSSLTLLKDERTFERIYEKLSDDMLFEIITNSETALKLFDNKQIDPLRLLLFIARCGQDPRLTTFKNHFKAQCTERLTVQDINMMGPEHIEAKDYVLSISLQKADKLEAIAKCSVQWISWFKDHPVTWITMLVEQIPDHCDPNLFLQLNDEDANEDHLRGLSMAFMTLVKRSPTLLKQASWNKVAALMLPHLYSGDRQTVLVWIDEHAHAQIYPMFEEKYDAFLPTLKSRFEKLNISGGLSLASSDNAGALSIAKQTGDLTITDDSV